jgi:hypothetical protein
MVVSISISDAFDGGNIQHVSTAPSTNDPSVLEVALQIKSDKYTELERIQHLQYFCFRATINRGDDDGNADHTVKYSVVNASKTSYPLAWKGSSVFYSNDYSDVDGWKRVVDTFYTEGNLWWEYPHTAKESTVFFTYFPPYSYERHLSLISKCQHAKVETLGQSLDGREIECVTVGTGNLVCWIIHRQHPGETMAEHYAEGMYVSCYALFIGSFPRRRLLHSHTHCGDHRLLLLQVF